MAKLTKFVPDFDDSKAAESLARHWQDFEGRKFLIGLHGFWIKAQIKHGEFGPWLKKHAPELCRSKDGTPQANKQLAEAMLFCREAAEKAGFTIDKLLADLAAIEIPLLRGDLPGSDLLLLENNDLNDSARTLRDKLLKGIQAQLALENGDKKPKEFNPRKLTPEQKIEAEIEQCQSILTQAVTGVQLVLDDVLSEKGRLASHIAKADWKNFVRLTTAANKAVRPLCKTKTKKAKE
jgi:hypothetical protein